LTTSKQKKNQNVRNDLLLKKKNAEKRKPFIRKPQRDSEKKCFSIFVKMLAIKEEYFILFFFSNGSTYHSKKEGGKRKKIKL